MKGRNPDGKYTDDVQDLVKAANAENREIVGTPELFEKLGHLKRNPKHVKRELFLEFMGDQPSKVRKFTYPRSTQWPYRLGKNPFSDRKGGFQ
jgi:hypothetical protein